jgi:hypothetical protein
MENLAVDGEVEEIGYKNVKLVHLLQESYCIYTKKYKLLRKYNILK